MIKQLRNRYLPKPCTTINLHREHVENKHGNYNLVGSVTMPCLQTTRREVHVHQSQVILAGSVTLACLQTTWREVQFHQSVVIQIADQDERWYWLMYHHKNYYY